LIKSNLSGCSLFTGTRALPRAGADYSHEPTTLVVFTLKEVANGVMLTVTESGFHQIPLERRAKAFQANEQGWGMVVKLMEKYLAKAA
jgi:Activator of Hsp90 ATPase homolog 1-like protein